MPRQIDHFGKPDDSTPKHSEATGLLESLKAPVVAITTAASFEAGSRTLFGDVGWSDVIVPIASAIGLLLASLYLVFAKVPINSRVAPEVRQKEPRFAENLRWVGKAGSISMIALLLLRCWDIRPNFIAGEEAISGFICSQESGKAITNGTIEILSRSGGTMSPPERLDDRGYFYSDLKRWALRPTALRINGSGCSTALVVRLDTATQGVCSSAGEVNSPHIFRNKEWIITCAK